MITTDVIDGFGTGSKMRVNPEGTIDVVSHLHPPINDTLSVVPFRQYFTDDGTPDGDNDMIVNGGTTPVDFSIEAHHNHDIYIKYISVVIGDGGSPTLNKFGALTALTNGVSWSWFTQDEGRYELHEGIKSNLDFIRIGGDTAAIGTGVDSFLADVSGGGSEKSYLPNIDIAETFGMTWGLRLKKGTNDKLIFTVNDALAGLVTFNIIGYGSRL